ncbi:GGDEF domain-containing protein [Pelagerythrobacter sp.]|uniref:GGDEF domain-containing protein n=1 Tax=Pelagerythrobacter sp. TaxID=2800702 RepID=UPI0035B45EB3
MVEDFTLHEGAALYGLLAETDSDIVIKLDREGLVIHASAAIDRLGIELPGMLIRPHLADLAEPAQAEKLRAFLEVVMRGGSATGWFEFAARTADGGANWYTLQLRPLLDGTGEVCGALGIMRSIEERRALEQKLFAATLTDPLTGLANRRAFRIMLRHLARHRSGGSLAILDIAQVRRIGLRHGARAGDRVITVFAVLLRDLLRREHIVARIGDERFGVLLPNDGPAAATCVVRAVLDELAEATHAPGSEDQIDLRACVGIAPIGASADATMQHADLALIRARARGRGKIECAQDSEPQRRRA